MDGTSEHAADQTWPPPHKNDLKILSKRIKELGHKSTLLLLFLSFTMVSVATLENVHDAKPEFVNALNKALFWWKLALIPTLLGVPPLKEVMWQRVEWYRIIRGAKVLMMWAAVILILVGLGFFIAA